MLFGKCLHLGIFIKSKHHHLLLAESGESLLDPYVRSLCFEGVGILAGYVQAVRIVKNSVIGVLHFLECPAAVTLTEYLVFVLTVFELFLYFG